MANASSEDQTDLRWRSVEYTEAFGALTSQTVLDYFAQSPFFDRTSNNAVLRMQTQFSVAPGGSLIEAEELKKFVGIEFAVAHSEAPDLFVIEKRDRTGPDDARVLAVYYVLHNSIYQAPDLYFLISNRLLSSLYYMQTSLAAARDKKSDFSARSGGNRYIVDRAMDDLGGGTDLASNGTSETDNVLDDKNAQHCDSGPNLDYLLARALRTTMANLQAAT